MTAIKNKCGKDGGDRKHSLAMTEDFMAKMFAWSDEVCPASDYDKKSTTVEEQNLKTKHLAFKCFASTSWTIWSRYVNDFEKRISSDRVSVVLSL
jgi:hypothetical protein